MAGNPQSCIIYSYCSGANLHNSTGLLWRQFAQFSRVTLAPFAQFPRLTLAPIYSGDSEAIFFRDSGAYKRQNFSNQTSKTPRALNLDRTEPFT